MINFTFCLHLLISLRTLTSCCVKSARMGGNAYILILTQGDKREEFPHLLFLLTLSIYSSLLSNIALLASEGGA
jgi:hypothetical protein